MQTRKFTVSLGAKKMRSIFAAMAFGLALCVALIGFGNGASAGVPAGVPTANQASKIEAVVLRDTADGKSTSVMVLMADQADVNTAYSMKDQDARGWYIYNTLTSHAERTQASLRASLATQGVKYRSFWAVNALEVTVDRALLETLAARSDVGKIESNKATRWIEDPEIANFSPANDAPDVVEWGVQRVNAPQVWAMGFTGQGIVIANQDTGIRWSHNGLKPKYRGWNGATADHNYNWWDAIHSGGGSCGPNTVVPCDDNGHGTHTMGTSVGDDGAGNQVGVAPGAKWIGCRNMNVGAGTPATYTECFQFFIAPTDLAGQNANPALRPHVMNNSWGCPPSEGCSPTSLQTIIENTQAAGIFVEASAGNSGSACSTVNDPPAIYAASFSTGATDINNVLASFSSRGPVTVDGSNRRKPDISAPGVNVRSTTRTSDTSYGNLSGTSMAGPHVVGVVALLWSARPELTRMISETKTILQNTANPNITVSSGATTCGGISSTTIPNNHFGYGRVDALAAVNSVQQGTPTPTMTGTPPTATRTSTTTNTAVVTATNTAGSATATTCAVLSEGFESGTLGQFSSVVAQCVPGGCGWTSTTTNPRSGTRSAFAPDPANITDQYLQLTNPVSAVSGATLTFWHHYNLEDTYDGGVIEATTNNGTSWTDMQANIVSGGYTDLISSSFGSPIAGRMAWSGNSGGYVMTTVNLTPYAGQSLRFRFRLATDNSVSAVGWNIDDIAIGGSCATGTPSTATSTVVLPTSTRTNTVVLPTSTSTVVAPSATRTNTALAPSSTSMATSVATNTAVASATSTACTITFTDVPPSNPFYTWIRCLACRGVLGGYDDGTFRPFNDITRSQIAKVVSNAAGFTEDPGPQIYADVPPSNVFYPFINRLTLRGHVGGYDCGGPGEPCNGTNMPYFRPYNNATRGQLSKIVSNAAGITDPVPAGTQTYTDVPPSNPFYIWIERLTARGVMSGYDCGGPGEPCDSQNRPYFRPYNNVTRGQAAKIVANTFYPGCVTPSRP